MAYNWTFASWGGNTGVRIASAEDIRHLGELDQKLWTVLSCPTKGLEMDEQTLQFLDTDGDGRVRVKEVVAAAEWLSTVLHNPQTLIDSPEEISKHNIQDAALLELAQQITDDYTLTINSIDAAIARMVEEASHAQQEALPEAPYSAEVVAAYKESKEAYAKYFHDLRMQELGLYTIPAETPVPGIKEEEWKKMGAAIAEHEAACAAIAASNAAAVQVDTARFTPLRKLALLHRDFYTLLRNFVSLEDFYGKSRPAIFQAGTLIIDRRACHLCVRVEDMGKHNAQAAASGMYLAYCTCTSKTLGKTMDIVAVITAGDIHNLMVGKNAIFYDRQGRDWEATVTKIVDNPISIKQAFWSPYRKFADWVSGLINKSVAEKEAKGFEDMKASATTTVEQSKTAAAEPAAKPAPSFDIAKFAGIFAAIGMAIGYIGAFLTSLATGIATLTWWQFPLVVIGLLLCISGPSMLMAYFKIRKRNLAPVLNANGWAINAEAIVNVKFGATLTDEAKFPLLKMDDPFRDEETPLWQKFFYGILCAAVVVCGLWLGGALKWAGLESPLMKEAPAEEVVVEEAPAVEEAAPEVAETTDAQ